MEPQLRRVVEDLLISSVKTDRESGIRAGESSFSSTEQEVVIQIESHVKSNPGLRDRLAQGLLTLVLADKNKKLRIFNQGRTKSYRDTRVDWEDRITGGGGRWGEWDETQEAYMEVPTQL